MAISILLRKFKIISITQKILILALLIALPTKYLLAQEEEEEPTFEEAVEAFFSTRPSIPCHELSQSVSYVGPYNLVSLGGINLPWGSHISLNRYDRGAPGQHEQHFFHIEHQNYKDDEKWYLQPIKNPVNAAEVVWVLFTAQKNYIPLTIHGYLPSGVCEGCTGVPFVDQTIPAPELNWPGRNGIPNDIEKFSTWARENIRKSTGTLGWLNHTNGYGYQTPYRDLKVEYNKPVQVCTGPSDHACTNKKRNIKTEYLVEELCTVRKSQLHSFYYSKRHLMPSGCSNIPLYRWSNPEDRQVAECIINLLKTDSLNQFERWTNGLARLIPIIGSAITVDKALTARECKDNLMASIQCWGHAGVSVLTDATIFAAPIAKAGTAWAPAALRSQFIARSSEPAANLAGKIQQKTSAEFMGAVAITSDAGVGLSTFFDTEHGADIARTAVAGIIVYAMVRKNLGSGSTKVSTLEKVPSKAPEAVGGKCLNATAASRSTKLTYFPVKVPQTEVLDGLVLKELDQIIAESSAVLVRKAEGQYLSHMMNQLNKPKSNLRNGWLNAADPNGLTTPYKHILNPSAYGEKTPWMSFSDILFHPKGAPHFSGDVIIEFRLHEYLRDLKAINPMARVGILTQRQLSEHTVSRLVSKLNSNGIPTSNNPLYDSLMQSMQDLSSIYPLTASHWQQIKSNIQALKPNMSSSLTNKILDDVKVYMHNRAAAEFLIYDKIPEKYITIKKL